MFIMRNALQHDRGDALVLDGGSRWSLTMHVYGAESITAGPTIIVEI